MKLIVVTPAGREKYMRLLSHYVLGSDEVAEWHLWENCRNEADRKYLHKLAASDPRCKLKQLDGAKGGWGIIGEFFQFCDDREALYLRLDDDIVYIESGFFRRFIERAKAERGKSIWFAPLIINNTVCGSLIKNLSKVEIDGVVTAQAMCPWAWKYPNFPEALHPVFIEAVKSGRLDDFRVPDRELRMGRFSINAIGFFGSDRVDLGETFMPPGCQTEEEWLSVVLPMKLDRAGKVLGDLIVSHFSFYTQERRLLQTDILEGYYEIAGIPVPDYDKPDDLPTPPGEEADPGPEYRISLRP